MHPQIQGEQMEDGSGTWLPQDHHYSGSACLLVTDLNVSNDEAVYLPNKGGEVLEKPKGEKI